MYCVIGREIYLSFFFFLAFIESISFFFFLNEPAPPEIYPLPLPDPLPILPSPPRMVTTLHGTDITYVGSDPSYRHVVAFSIEQSHAVTAVSSSLRSDTIATLGIAREIHVIRSEEHTSELQSRLHIECRLLL